MLRLAKDEFFRRFMLHVLPDDFHRIRRYGLLAGAGRKINIAQIRNLIGAAPPVAPPEAAVELIAITLREPRPCCDGPMRIIEIFRPHAPCNG